MCNIDGVADWSLAAPVFDFAITGASDIINSLVRIAVTVQPALDDLHAIEIGAVRIT